MPNVILGLLAETAIHPGAGQSTGTVDLPVARESATDLPVIVGSGLKGALRDMARQRLGDGGEVDHAFGKQENAGNLMVSDARLLLLPVRSLSGHYRWLTCPYLLERLQRDMLRAENPMSFAMPKPAKGSILSSDSQVVWLEEREFTVAGTVGADVLAALKTLVLHADTAARMARQVAVVHDDDFTWFARYGLSVNARNQLNPDTKTSENLWYEETVPADALFFASVYDRGTTALPSLQRLFAERPYVQVGGNETVGQGWMAVTMIAGGR